ncbi:MAG TPA: hypothetical protein VGJ79_09530 [Candidatus Dormibacteraeota bacterium]|jgi:hypothetical protein
MQSYGFGSGPVYLSGQSDWYAGGQAAFIRVDSSYRGAVTIRASQFGGDGASTIALADQNFPEAAVDKERQHGFQVVSATRLPGGGLTLAADGSPSASREWFGLLSTSGPGCFAINADGDNFSEVIVIWVNPGAPPPG